MEVRCVAGYWPLFGPLRPVVRQAKGNFWLQGRISTHLNVHILHWTQLDTNVERQ